MKPSEVTLAGSRTEPSWVHALLVIASGALHLGMLSSSLEPVPSRAVPAGPIEIAIVEEPEPEAAPLPPLAAPPEPPPLPSVAPKTSPEAAEAPQQEPTPADPTPEAASAIDDSPPGPETDDPDTAPDLLSEHSAGAADFVIGSARTTLLRPAVRSARPAATDRTTPALVALSALGKKPTPPDLSSALEHNYPSTARQLGLNGKATLRARVDADGKVRAVEPVVASAPDFAEACAKTLKNSLWGAPRDNQGTPVATWIRYTCRFEANR